MAFGERPSAVFRAVRSSCLTRRSSAPTSGSSAPDAGESVIGQGCRIQPVAGDDVNFRSRRRLIEVDLGTESLPTLLRKCGQYEVYRRSGVEQAEHGSFPLVLWLFTNQARADELRRRIQRTASLTSELYRYALLDEATIHRTLSDQDGEAI